MHGQFNVLRFAVYSDGNGSVYEAVLYSVAEQVGEYLRDAGLIPFPFRIPGNINNELARRMSSPRFINHLPGHQTKIHRNPDNGQSRSKPGTGQVENMVDDFIAAQCTIDYLREQHRLPLVQRSYFQRKLSGCHYCGERIAEVVSQDT